MADSVEYKDGVISGDEFSEWGLFNDVVVERQAIVAEIFDIHCIPMTDMSGLICKSFLTKASRSRGDISIGIELLSTLRSVNFIDSRRVDAAGPAINPLQYFISLIFDIGRRVGRKKL